MRFGIYLPNFGAFGDVDALIDLARRAESAGWDGFFVWDHLVAPSPIVDPWVALTAVAAKTDRISLGLLIVPLARRRPWRVALEAATLQQVAKGRLVLGVGMGVARDYARFGEPANWRGRAERLEEGIALLSRLLAGEEVTTSGGHYSLDRVRLTPASVPIWASGMWPRRRSIHGARYAQGFFPIMKSVPHDTAGNDPRGRDRESHLGVARPSPTDLRDFRARALADGAVQNADIVLWTPDGSEGVDLEAYRDAGVTWWLQGEEQGAHGAYLAGRGEAGVDEVRRLIEAGPRSA